MNTWKGLLTREWLEHKGAIGWGPVITFGIFVGLILLSLALAGTLKVDIDGTEHTSVRSLFDDTLSNEIRSEAALRHRLDEIRHGVAGIFIFVFAIVAFFTLLGMLYDDRKDRSVLFWKSIPASDTQTVLSKYITIAWVAPVATIAMIMATYLFIFLVLSFLMPGEGVLTIGNLWTNSGLIMGFTELVIGFAINGLWVMPIWAWLLFVSSAVPKGPFVWAVFAPATVCLVERIAFGTKVLAQGIFNHMDFKAIPTVVDISLDDSSGHRAMDIGGSFALLATSDMWIGIIIGAALLYGAIYFRNRNNEI